MNNLKKNIFIDDEADEEPSSSLRSSINDDSISDTSSPELPMGDEINGIEKWTVVEKLKSAKKVH